MGELIHKQRADREEKYVQAKAVGQQAEAAAYVVTPAGVLRINAAHTHTEYEGTGTEQLSPQMRYKHEEWDVFIHKQDEMHMVYKHGQHSQSLEPVKLPQSPGCDFFL